MGSGDERHPMDEEEEEYPTPTVLPKPARGHV
jgi:hypothetical protein